jgi:putative transposase
MRTLLSSYTRAVQKQESFTGSLFQQNTKNKELVDDSYAHTCFHYIHQNPLKAKLVARIEDWSHHSFNEYMGTLNGFCNTGLAKEILTIPTQPDQFYKESYNVIDELSILELLEE